MERIATPPMKDPAMTSRTHPRQHQDPPAPKVQPLPTYDTIAPYEEET